MSRSIVVAGLVGWIGLSVLLTELRWFRRQRLVERLRPYAPGGAPTTGAPRNPPSALAAVLPLVTDLTTGLARIVGAHDHLTVRLERIHSPLSPSAFRTRQTGWVVAAFGLAALTSLALRPPDGLALLLILGAPLLAFLLVEQQLASASAGWQRHLFLELPVVAEQLGMLLSAGFSLGSALNRLAERGHGCCARDLTRVTRRIRQGLSEIDALREWSAVADVEAVRRLVGVLALNRDGGDLGHLITEEARAMRRDAHRELIESVEKRAQQVWIPVTVATLVPGVLLLAVPFVEAMRLFSSG